MTKMWAVCKREFVGYFITPIGYVVAGVYAAITGIGFVASFIFYARVSQSPATYDYQGVPDLEETMLSPFLVFCGQVLLFLAPLITMRLLAEEKHRGTIELLLTHPLRDREIIFGKYLAALGMTAVLVLMVGVDMAIVGWVTQVETAVLLFGLLAVFLMAASFLTVGLFISAVAKNPMTAATATFGAFFVTYILGAVSKDLPETIPTPESLSEGMQRAAAFLYGIFRGIAIELPIDAHARDMAEGIVQPEDIAYYLLFSAFFLFLTFRALESRKWRAFA